MEEYHKIQTVYKRNPETGFKTLLDGEYSNPEFEYLKNNKWIFTEKVDGTNIRVMFDGKGITFGGRTDNATIPAHLVTALNNSFMPIDVRKKFEEKFPDGVCLYGEGYGAKINNGGNYRQDQSFVLFDVRIRGYWLNRCDVEDVAKYIGIDIVPIIGTGTLIDMVTMARQRFNSRWGEFAAEGIVARPAVELKTRRGGRIITKIKAKDFTEGK